ncbi:MAG: NTP transferase domain-containing protein [Elusimicrobia bacterium]|nr:NTP transferase domain-containing protein [Elusimicrobiota bacterium]
MIHAGIIAAGLGERLKTAAGGGPKPLVEVLGRPLIDWTVDGLRRAGVGRITILLNSRGAPVRRRLEERFPDLRWRFLEWDSPSSWESFRRVCGEVAAEADRFLVSTVDALIPPPDVRLFAARALSADADAALALTLFVDDEKPLWADLDEGGRVTGVGPDARERRWVTCGLYAVSRAAARAQAGLSYGRLRDYWTALAKDARVAGVPLGPTLDVDRPEDVATAEDFIRRHGAWTQEQTA